MPDIYTLDFESFYDTDYSLSKMQTEAYVEDARFETIGMGIGKNDGNIHWFTEPSDITHVLDRINWDNCAVRAHNTHFDGLILSHRYGKNPAQWRDTLASGRMMRPYFRQHSLGYMAKALGLPDKGNEVIAAKGKRRADFTPAELHAYGEYCKLDTALCRTIGDIFDPYTPALYEYLIDMTVRMFTEPALVGNRQMMQELYQAELDRKARLLVDASVDRSIIMSGDKLARALLDLGVVAPRKVSAKTGKETWAFAKTDKVFCDLLEHEDPQVQALVAARLGVKSTIAETRAKTYAEMTDRGPLRVFLAMWGAKTTGRYSGTNKCLVGTTRLLVRRDNEVLDILMSSLRADDLVWDGVEFVAHGGLVCRGFKEVIEYGGVTGTPDHRVYVEGRTESVELAVAAREGCVLQDGRVAAGMGQASQAVPDCEG